MISIIGLWGCKKPEVTISEYRAGLGGKVYGGTYAYHEPITMLSLDPTNVSDLPSAEAAKLIFEPLVSYDPESQRLVSGLASRWEISPDGLNYTFYLRDNILFHDDRCFPASLGRKLSSDDVKFSFERACDPAQETLGLTAFTEQVIGASDYYNDHVKALKDVRTPFVEEIKGIEVIDELTLKIRLTKPFGGFLASLTAPPFYIVPKEPILFYGANFKYHPVGTGPFKFAELSQGKQLVLHHNKTFRQKDAEGNLLPYLNEVKIIFNLSDSARIALFKSKTLTELSPIPKSLRSEYFLEAGTVFRAQSDSSIDYLSRNLLQAGFCGMNTTRSTFSDKRVRQAFNFAIDKSQLVESTLTHEAIAASQGIVPISIDHYNTGLAESGKRPSVKSADKSKLTIIKNYEFNPDKSRSLLKEAGFANGVGFPLITLDYSNVSDKNALIAKTIQSMLLSNLNIRIELRGLDSKAFADSIESGSSVFFLDHLNSSYPDPENILRSFYSKRNSISTAIKNAGNRYHYSNIGFDSLFANATHIMNDTLRYHKFEQAESVLLSDAPIIPLYYVRSEWLLHGDLKNTPIQKNGTHNLKQVWFNRLEAASK